VTGAMPAGMHGEPAGMLGMAPRRAHLPEYLCEFAGTAVILVVGLSAAVFDFASSSPVPRAIPSAALRRLITGAVTAGTATAVVYSPIGRRSGGHFNPAVTLAFFRLGKVVRRDAVAYAVAQTLGALAGASGVWLIWRGYARTVHDGATLPGSHGVWVAFAAEVLIAFALVTLILNFVARMRIAPYTAVAAACLVTACVVLVGPISGSSPNPARSWGPAVMSATYRSLWVYLVAPPIGALVAAALYRGRQARTTLCAKLYHDDAYPCPFVACAYQPSPVPERSA
jgi:aquaporin Z